MDSLKNEKCSIVNVIWLSGVITCMCVCDIAKPTSNMNSGSAWEVSKFETW